MKCVCTIGFFDGVHRGHQCLIRQVRDEALRRGARSLLITFDRHPRAVFAPDSAPRLLTSTDEKMALLRASGVDDIRVLPFDQPMAALSARQFMQQVLRDQLGVTALVIGYDHHFGHPQGETFADYQAMGRQLGLYVVLARELAGAHVSSSTLRRALEAGDVETATRLLGRPYSWTGHVVHGHAVGRQLGFPTANLEASAPDKLLPARGAYTVYAGTQPALLNIGRRPTIDNGSDTTVEAHLIDFQGDLYGQTITVAFIARLREERRFDSEQQLVEQLRRDKEEAIERLKDSSPALPWRMTNDELRMTNKSNLSDSSDSNSYSSFVIRHSSLNAKHSPLPSRPFWVYILFFFFSQIASIVLPFAAQLSGFTFHLSSPAGGSQGAFSPLVLALFTANLLAIVLFLLCRPQSVTWRSTLAGLRGHRGRQTLRLCLTAVPVILLVNLAQEALFPDIPNLVSEETLLAIMRHPLGLFTIAVLGPLAEELLFRGGVQTDLQRRHSDQGVWVPIGLSAAIFALIHMNPAQMPVALVLGGYLGYAYWRTGSLAAPVCIHIFNNGLACLLALLLPGSGSLIQALGGPLPALLVALVSLLALSLPGQLTTTDKDTGADTRP